SVFFGALIAIAGCLRGMQCGKSSASVGEAATSAVVTGIVLIIAADGLFAVLHDVLGVCPRADPRAHIVVHALTLAYGDRVVLTDLDFSVKRGQVFIVMGPSGCGKSTVLRNL